MPDVPPTKMPLPHLLSKAAGVIEALADGCVYGGLDAQVVSELLKRSESGAEQTDSLGLLVTMRGQLYFSNLMGKWCAHAPNGKLNEDGFAGMLHEFSDSATMKSLATAVSKLFARWEAAGRPGPVLALEVR